MSFSQPADRPLLMLPVQLQARFVGKHLRLRVLPDLIHGDNHDAGLTAREIVAGTAYWTQIRTAESEASTEEVEAITAAARERLAGQTGPYRALWVTGQTKPLNWESDADAAALEFPKLKPIDAHAPMRARLLPRQWVARLYDDEGGLIGEYLAPKKVDPELRLAPSLASVPGHGQSMSGDHVIDFLERQNLGWTADFSKALDAGMAFEIPRADLPHRIAAVIVAGLHEADGGRNEAQAFEELLTAHWYRRGVETMPQGTPTNNSDAAGTGFSVRALDLGALFAAEETRRPLSPAGRGILIRALPEALYQLPAADCQALSLGLFGQSVLDRNAQAETLEGLGAWAMNMAVGYGTIGRYGSDVLVHADGSSKVDFLADLRDHYSAWVRGGAHVPVLRVGPQPYGILPITDSPPVYFGWSDDFTVKFDHYLSQLIDRFSRRTAAATLDPDATDGRPGTTPEANAETVFDVLGAVPHPTNLQTRVLTDHIEEDAATFNDIMEALDAAANNDPTPIGEDTDGNYYFFHTTYWDPRRAQLTGVPSTDVPYAYVYDIGAQWSQVESLIVEVENYAPSHIRDEMLDIIENRLRPLLNIYLDGAKSIPDLWRELFDGGGISGGEPPAVRYKSFARLIGCTFSETSTPVGDLVASPDEGLKPLIDLLDAALDALVNPEAPGKRENLLSDAAPLLFHLINDTYQRVPSDQTEAVQRAFFILRARIDTLAVSDEGNDAVTQELELLMRASLGLAMHRIDAWVTSRAAEKLALARKEHPTGLRVGGYGWLLDLVPSDQPPSQGYIHAASLRQAATAGILRAGWSAFGTKDGTKPLSTDMSSRRTRNARQLAQALRQGQDLGEVLGAMFERGLHDRDVDRWIDDVRAALNPIAGMPHPRQSQVAGLLIARSGFVDKTPDEVAASVALDVVLADMPSNEADAVRAARDDAGETLDSLSDLVMTQAVHALAQGDADTAGAALSMTGGGDAVVPPMDALDTQREARLVTHRVALTFAGTSKPVAGVPVSQAEPGLHRWISKRLPTAKTVALRAIINRDDKSTTLDIRLSDLGLDAVAAAALMDERPSQAAGRIARLAIAFARVKAGDGAEIAIETHNAGRNRTPLDDFALRAAPLMRALGAGRAMRATDLLAPGAELPEGAEPASAQLEARIDGLRQEFETAATTVKTADDASVRALAGGLEALGLPGALALAEAAGDQAARIRVVDALSARIEVLDDPLVAPEDRLGAAIGGALPVLAPFRTGQSATLRNSLRDGPRQAELADKGDDWWRKVARVRPPLVSLATHCSLHEAMEQADALSPALLQMPHVPGEGWAAVNRPEGRVYDRMSMFLLDGEGGLAQNKPVAGVVFDSWTEGVPAPDLQTGIAWHYDAPSARAPQSMLLATTDADVFDTDRVFAQLQHVIKLMKMRAMEPDRLRFAPPPHLPQSEFDPEYIEPAIGQYLPGTWLDEEAKLSGVVL